jgi:SAM-dependent methyltransferase
MVDLRGLRPNYSVRRRFIDDFLRRQVAQLPSGSRVLDLGGHKTGKQGRFDIGSYNVETVYLNITTGKLPDIQADGAQLPVASGSFDAVICTEVLEHVPDPRLLTQEAYRVLRPGGGQLIATVPFLYRIHADPYDFGRYTDTFWNTTLREQGFDSVQIERHGAFYAVMLDFLRQYVGRMGRASRTGTLVARLTHLAVVAPLQPLVLRYEQKPRVKEHPFLRSFTTGFGIVATKLPVDEQEGSA